ncbi:MAG TPA: hypothetical protein VN132_11020 [Bdellovibrio sp.]|nr:hypothetical protein [Bdellovibrio sp.]
MSKLILSLCFALTGCATKTVCVNGNESFRPVLDPEKSCSVRIREVVIGSEMDIPKSISFKDSNAAWSYRWIESSYKDGAFEMGHFVLVPLNRDSN